MGYSHGEMRHRAPAPMSLLTISGSGRGEGTGSAASTGGGDAGIAAPDGCRGKSTGAAAFAALLSQQLWCE